MAKPTGSCPECERLVEFDRRGEYMKCCNCFHEIPVQDFDKILNDHMHYTKELAELNQRFGRD